MVSELQPTRQASHTHIKRPHIKIVTEKKSSANLPCISLLAVRHNRLEYHAAQDGSANTHLQSDITRILKKQKTIQ